jgi:hypothetical protein
MKKRPILTALNGVRRGTSAPSAQARECARRAELAVQLETLLDHVWRCEREWALDDRIALGCRRSGIR